MKKLIILLLVAFSATTLYAQPPGYYTSALGKNGAALQTALKNIIDNHNSLTFPLWSAFASTDNKGSNILWDMYSDVPGGTPSYSYTLGSDQCGQYNSEGDCYNHEHVWPKTYYNDGTPMNSDLHHVVPTDGWVNNKRANFPLGDANSGGYSSSNGTKTGTSSSFTAYTGLVFEPIDAYKGDFARMFFYTSTRYKGEDNGWKNWEMANGAVLTSDAIKLLLKWHNDDTVSQKEIARNNAIYSIQGNRNPFIDYPIFADCIWGTTDCTPLDIEDILFQGIKLYPNPAYDLLQIEIPSVLTSQSIKFEIINAVGQKLISTSEQSISIASLPKGFYALRIITEEKSSTLSFIKK